MKLLSVQDARARMLAAVDALPAETVAIEHAAGRVLAQAVIAYRDQPPFNASAMDGWAVRRADALHAVADLAIVGESAAGRGHDASLSPGQAVRIFTGAAVPDGADVVVIQEEAERHGEMVRLGPLAEAVAYIRPRGGDFRAGARLIEPGQRLDAWRLSLAAAAGCGTLSVGRQPRIAVLSTGEELVHPPGEPGRFQIYDSGSLALCALIETWGGVAQRLAPARDDPAAVIAAVGEVQAELIVTIGGASVGDYDLVKPALGQLGLALGVASVNVRPGKPTWFGVLADGRRVLGLPGNPASAMVCAELFLRPLIMAMQGGDPRSKLLHARLAEALPANGSREHVMRAALTSSDDGTLQVRPFPDQDSSLVTVFATADALMPRAARAPAAAMGDLVDIIRLQRL
jgi:molybdopterin molybdotransferase